MRVMGMDYGAIMPTIMTAHMSNISEKSAAVQGLIWRRRAGSTGMVPGIDAAIDSPIESMVTASRTRYSHDTAATPSSPVQIAMRSRRGRETAAGPRREAGMAYRITPS